MAEERLDRCYVTIDDLLNDRFTTCDDIDHEKAANDFDFHFNKPGFDLAIIITNKSLISTISQFQIPFQSQFGFTTHVIYLPDFSRLKYCIKDLRLHEILYVIVVTETSQENDEYDIFILSEIIEHQEQMKYADAINLISADWENYTKQLQRLMMAPERSPHANNSLTEGFLEPSSNIRYLLCLLADCRKLELKELQKLRDFLKARKDAIVNMGSRPVNYGFHDRPLPSYRQEKFKYYVYEQRSESKNVSNVQQLNIVHGDNIVDVNTSMLSERNTVYLPRTAQTITNVFPHNILDVPSVNNTYSKHAIITCSPKLYRNSNTPLNSTSKSQSNDISKELATIPAKNLFLKTASNNSMNPQNKALEKPMVTKAISNPVLDKKPYPVSRKVGEPLPSKVPLLPKSTDTQLPSTPLVSEESSALPGKIISDKSVSLQIKSTTSVNVTKGKESQEKSKTINNGVIVVNPFLQKKSAHTNASNTNSGQNKSSGIQDSQRLTYQLSPVSSISSGKSSWQDCVVYQLSPVSAESTERALKREKTIEIDLTDEDIEESQEERHDSVPKKLRRITSPSLKKPDQPPLPCNRPDQPTLPCNRPDQTTLPCNIPDQSPVPAKEPGQKTTSKKSDQPFTVSRFEPLSPSFVALSAQFPTFDHQVTNVSSNVLINLFRFVLHISPFSLSPESEVLRLLKKCFEDMEKYVTDTGLNKVEVDMKTCRSGGCEEMIRIIESLGEEMISGRYFVMSDLKYMWQAYFPRTPSNDNPIILFYKLMKMLESTKSTSNCNGILLSTIQRLECVVNYDFHLSDRSSFTSLNCFSSLFQEYYDQSTLLHTLCVALPPSEPASASLNADLDKVLVENKVKFVVGPLMEYFIQVINSIHYQLEVQVMEDIFVAFRTLRFCLRKICNRLFPEHLPQLVPFTTEDDFMSRTIELLDEINLMLREVTLMNCILFTKKHYDFINLVLDFSIKIDKSVSDGTESDQCPMDLECLIDVDPVQFIYDFSTNIKSAIFPYHHDTEIEILKRYLKNRWIDLLHQAFKGIPPPPDGSRISKEMSYLLPKGWGKRTFEEAVMEAASLCHSDWDRMLNNDFLTARITYSDVRNNYLMWLSNNGLDHKKAMELMTASQKQLDSKIMSKV